VILLLGVWLHLFRRIALPLTMPLIGPARPRRLFGGLVHRAGQTGTSSLRTGAPVPSAMARPGASSRGGEESGSGSSPTQGGTTAQKREAGRKGGKATAAKKSS
jgi:hypothetical protein